MFQGGAQEPGSRLHFGVGARDEPRAGRPRGQRRIQGTDRERRKDASGSRDIEKSWETLEVLGVKCTQLGWVWGPKPRKARVQP